MSDEFKAPEEKIDAFLVSLWQRHLPQLHERLDLLDRVAAEAHAGNLPEPSRIEALSIAHKLAGSLGMFGHHRASEIASQMEPILKAPTAEMLTTLSNLTLQLRQSLIADL